MYNSNKQHKKTNLIHIDRSSFIGNQPKHCLFYPDVQLKIKHFIKSVCKMKWLVSISKIQKFLVESVNLENNELPQK